MTSVAVNATLRSLNPRLHTATVPGPSGALPPPPPKTKRILKLAPPEGEDEDLEYSDEEPWEKHSYAIQEALGFGHKKEKKSAPPPPAELTIKQLAEFDEFEYNIPFINPYTKERYTGDFLGKNKRGDLVDADFNYMGQYDATKRRIIPAVVKFERGEPVPVVPKDWLEIRKASMDL